MRDDDKDYERLVEMLAPLAAKKPVYPTLVTEMGVVVEGLNRKELFAGMAMQGLAHKMNLVNPLERISPTTIAILSVQISNALCAELDKTEEEKKSIQKPQCEHRWVNHGSEMECSLCGNRFIRT